MYREDIESSLYLYMHIRVNNIDWQIIFTSNVNDLSTSSGNVTIGVTDNNTNTIYLYEKLRGKLLRKVLIHELTHAWIFSYGYYLTVEEEEFVCSFVDTYAEEIIFEAENLLNYFRKTYLHSHRK